MVSYTENEEVKRKNILNSKLFEKKVVKRIVNKNTKKDLQIIEGESGS